MIVRNAGGGGSRDVHLDRICVSNGGEELITDASLTLAAGRRYGLVGCACCLVPFTLRAETLPPLSPRRNGTGKTTFLRAFAARQLPGLPATLSILHVEQEVVGDDTSALDCVLACDAERAALLAEEAALLAAGDAAKGGDAAADALRRVYDRMSAIDAAGAPARAAAILAGLSFDPEAQKKPTRAFSGGWRMVSLVLLVHACSSSLTLASQRLALARALFVGPDVLLLGALPKLHRAAVAPLTCPPPAADEPTNHLDLHAVLWLQDYLLTWPGTLIIVSHAREFLNAVCTDVVHLQSRTLTTYRGDYDCFEATRAERARNATKAAEAASVRRAQVQAFIDRFRYNAKRASLVQSRIKALERMAEVRGFDVDPETVFRFPEPAEASGQLMSFDDVTFSYTPGGRTIFRDVRFGLDADSRLAIVGPNGIGKSTLLGLIGGSLSPTAGHITRSSKCRIAVFAQHHVDGLDMTLSPLAMMVRSYPGVLEQELRNHLGSFGVSGPLALQPIYTLSGGQKSRVALAKLTWPQPNLLLLGASRAPARVAAAPDAERADEITNHLDIDAIDALIEGLAAYKGGVLLVSHDQYFISAVADELWAVEGDGSVHPFEGTFAEYKKSLKRPGH